MTASDSVRDSSPEWVFPVNLSDEDIAAVGTVARERLSGWALGHILVSL